jgi:hypothetical protein
MRERSKSAQWLVVRQWQWQWQPQQKPPPPPLFLSPHLSAPLLLPSQEPSTSLLHVSAGVSILPRSLTRFLLWLVGTPSEPSVGHQLMLLLVVSIFFHVHACDSCPASTATSSFAEVFCSPSSAPLPSLFAFSPRSQSSSLGQSISSSFSFNLFFLFLLLFFFIFFFFVFFFFFLGF